MYYRDANEQMLVCALLEDMAVLEYLVTGVATARRSSNATRTRSSPTGPSSWTMKMTS